MPLQKTVQHKSGQAHRRSSGQAIIFLMVVVVIGLFVVIWNYDLFRIISAKVHVRNAADSAAMVGARWQGVTLNMIGDLNLIQAAELALEAEAIVGTTNPLVVPDSVHELHSLRERLRFFGPLAAFSLAQQAAFDNGASNDPKLAGDLMWLVDELREEPGAAPNSDLSLREYADMLENIVNHGVAVSSYTVRFRQHPLTQEKFYRGIALALAGQWYGLEDYEYQLEQYEDVDSWSKLDTEFRFFFMLDLKLQQWNSRDASGANSTAQSQNSNPTYSRPLPPDAIATNLEEYIDYIGMDRRGILQTMGADTNYLEAGIYPAEYENGPIAWHIYSRAWQKQWPKPSRGEADYEDEKEGLRFPIWSRIEERYDYMGAEAGFGISAPVHRGIVASASQQSVDLEFKAKAKPFGYIEGEDQDWPPYYFGFVFPVFTDVRLIPSDIGDQQVPAEFFRHVVAHLEAYLEGGPEALDPGCRYCQLLKAWEFLDRDEGLRRLDEAKDKEDTPGHPDKDGSEFDGLSGGATRGS